MTTKGKFLTVESLSIMPPKSEQGESKSSIEVSLEGITGDVHFGFIKQADGRDSGIKRGTPVRNWRQWSAVSQEELALIAKNMGLESLDPALLSANITFSGVDDFTSLPRGTRLFFENGAILDVEDENEPCVGPGKQIAKLHPEQAPHAFVKAAKNRRGLVGVVFKAGTIKVGEKAEIR